MSVETKLLMKLLSILEKLENEAEDDFFAKKEWSDGVVHSVKTIMNELGITKDALTGENKFDI